MTMIEWRPVDGCPGYSVSNTGLVRSEHRVVVMKNGVTKTVKEKILKPKRIGCGYLGVNIGGKNQTIHRLVATAFLGLPQPGCEVNHKDENKHNNNADNLEWITKRENLYYGTRIERSIKNGTKLCRPVIAMKDEQVVAEYRSLREAARAGFHRYHIFACCGGQEKTHKGFTWIYKNQ